MFRVPEVLQSLQQRARAEQIVRLLPVQGELLGDGYNLRAPEPGVKEVIVNLQRGTHSLALPPESVDYTFSEAQARSPHDLVPFCTEWKELPSQQSKPWYYACRLHAQGKTPIAVYASLAGDVRDPKTRVKELVLQIDE